MHLVNVARCRGNAQQSRSHSCHEQQGRSCNHHDPAKHSAAAPVELRSRVPPLRLPYARCEGRICVELALVTCTLIFTKSEGVWPATHLAVLGCCSELSSLFNLLLALQARSPHTETARSTLADRLATLVTSWSPSSPHRHSPSCDTHANDLPPRCSAAPHPGGPRPPCLSHAELYSHGKHVEPATIAGRSLLLLLRQKDWASRGVCMELLGG